MINLKTPFNNVSTNSTNNANDAIYLQISTYLPIKFQLKM